MSPPEQGIQNRKALIIFGICAIAATIAAFAAYQATGHMGIEERYSHAVGLPSHGVTGEDAAGSPIEGDPVLYGAILGGLLAICCIVYRIHRARSQ
jgi:hypothetical protein